MRCVRSFTDWVHLGLLAPKLSSNSKCSKLNTSRSDVGCIRSFEVFHKIQYFWKVELFVYRVSLQPCMLFLCGGYTTISWETKFFLKYSCELCFLNFWTDVGKRKHHDSAQPRTRRNVVLGSRNLLKAMVARGRNLGERRSRLEEGDTKTHRTESEYLHFESCRAVSQWESVV